MSGNTETGTAQNTLSVEPLISSAFKDTWAGTQISLVGDTMHRGSLIVLNGRGSKKAAEETAHEVQHRG